MNTDEERFFNDNADDTETARILDASVAQVESVNDDGLRRNSESSTATTATANVLQPPVRKPRWLLLELPVFLLFFASSLTTALNQNQLLYQTCVAVYQYNESTCEPLLSIERESKQTQEIEEEIQPYVARILMARSLIESIIPALVGLFIGPWSDKFGRRPILLNTFLGYPTGLAIFGLLAFISRKIVISPWWFLIASLPAIISGGSCALITGIYCYISDVVHDRSMSIRMIYNESSLCAGMMFGSIASSYIYEATNVFITFFIAAILAFISWTYIFLFIDESVKTHNTSAGSRFREFFRFDLVKDLVHTCIKRRANFDRAIIWSTILSLTLIIFTIEGENNLSYLFVRERFSWTLKDYTFYNAARIIVQIVGSIFGTMILRKLMNVSIISMTLLTFASCALESVVRATAVFWWELYIGMLLGMMRGVVGPMSRAILSHITPPTECGKIMAFTTSLESLSPLIAAPLYTIVYRETLMISPGAYYFISTAVGFICYTLVAYIYYIQKSFSNTQTYKAIGS